MIAKKQVSFQSQSRTKLSLNSIKKMMSFFAETTNKAGSAETPQGFDNMNIDGNKWQNFHMA